MTDIDFNYIKDLFEHEPRHILDIGANNGWTSRQFSETFPNTNIYAFEPDPRAAAKFGNNVQNDRVRLFQLALGNHIGTTTFYMSDGQHPAHIGDENYSDGWDLSGSIRKPKDVLNIHPWCAFERSIDVEVQTLDTWADHYVPEPIDFIWADVQGAEGDLIVGGTHTLARTRYFYTEFSEHELYEGQLNLSEIKRLLPNFEIVEVFQPRRIVPEL